jgi:hypothetical protein
LQFCIPEGTFLAFERPLYDQNAYEYLLQIEKEQLKRQVSLVQKS